MCPPLLNLVLPFNSDLILFVELSPALALPGPVAAKKGVSRAFKHGYGRGCGEVG